MKNAGFYINCYYIQIIYLDLNDWSHASEQITMVTGVSNYSPSLAL